MSILYGVPIAVVAIIGRGANNFSDTVIGIGKKVIRFFYIMNIFNICDMVAEFFLYPVNIEL